MTATTTLTTHQWADGFGLWHCRVTGPEETTQREFRAAAENAIQQEIDDRDASGPGWRVTVEYRDAGMTDDGLFWREFAEDFTEDDDDVA